LRTSGYVNAKNKINSNIKKKRINGLRLSGRINTIKVERKQAIISLNLDKKPIPKELSITKVNL
jgi:hypothetical protein